MASTQRFPRFLTYGPGELEALLRDQLGLAPDAPLPYETTGRDKLVKEYSFAVSYPDRTEGTCRYDRRGPSYHLFHYTYRDGTKLPVQWWTQRLANDLPTIAAKGKELATGVYARACEEERDRYFKRISVPCNGTRSPHPERSQMTVTRAKELAGRYALCLRPGKRLIAVSPSFGTLAEANAAWTQQQNTTLVVACCNRLDRCWEIPKYNPLYADFDPRIDEKEKGEFPWSSWK